MTGPIKPTNENRPSILNDILITKIIIAVPNNPYTANFLHFKIAIAKIVFSIPSEVYKYIPHNGKLIRFSFTDRHRSNSKYNSKCLKQSLQSDTRLNTHHALTEFRMKSWFPIVEFDFLHLSSFNIKAVN